MKYYTALSSEVYQLDPKDLVELRDVPQDALPIKDNEVVILLGDERVKEDDRLYQGREVVEQAVAQGVEYIPVRVAFYTRTPWFNLISSFVKGVRKHYFGYSMRTYHTTVAEITKLKIERSVRTMENAYTFSKPRKWVVGGDFKQVWFEKMKKSFQEKGYDDTYPMDIMLRRALGVKDNLHQGHHRMMFSREYGVERVAIKFMAAGHLPGWMMPVFEYLIKVTGYKSRAGGAADS